MSIVTSVEIPFVTTTGISVSNATIQDVGDPVSSQDAATKNYAENADNISKGVLGANYGGTGYSTYAVGDLLYADTTTTLAKLPDVAEGFVLLSGGVNTAPSYGKVGLAGHITGVLNVANGGTGTTSVPGSSGQLLMNSSGAYSSTSQISYNGSSTLTIGAINSTFTIAGKASTDTGSSGANIVIVGGASGNTGINGGEPGHVYVKGGPSGIDQAGAGGNVYIEGGSGPHRSGSVFISTGQTLTERLRITPDGAWGLSGANYGSSGQVLTSNGSSSAPTWQSLSGVGTVTSISVTAANGFGGSVATSTTTPAITITTSVTGLLKGNGTAISAATAGTDYQTPISLTTTGTSGAATFSNGVLNIPQYDPSLSSATGTLAVANGGTGLTAVPGSSGQLLMNSSGAYSATGRLSYNGTDTLSVGAQNTTFNISGVGGSGGSGAASVAVSAGSASTNFHLAGDLTLKSGNGAGNGSGGGTITIESGAPGTGGSAGTILLKASSTESLRIISGGAWGLGGANYGTSGQVLISNGSGSAPSWTTLSSVGTVTSIALSGGTTGLTTSGGPITSSGTITLGGTLAVANGGTGGTTASTAINNLLSGVTSISIGAVGATYAAATTTITGNSSVSTPTPFPGNIVIVGGTQSLTNSAAGDVTLQGGTSSGGGVTTGGNVILNGGSASSFPGYVAIKTHINSSSLVERLRITSSGAWSVGSNGTDYGTSGQVLTSNGNAAPTWQTISGSGTVTSIALSGGTTGLTTSGGPITSSGTITLDGTLAATNGGTGQSSWTTGDILYASGSNTLNKLSIGSTNQVLTVVAGVPAWAAASGGSSAANTLTGTTLASNVVSSSLTSVGTLTSLAISGATTFGTNYTETRTNVTASGTTTIDCSLGNIFNVTMSASIATLTLSNVPNSGRVYNLTLFLNQDSGGSKTVTWPGTVRWPSGSAPTLTTTGNKTDILNLVTHDGGTNWFGFVAGLNY